MFYAIISIDGVKGLIETIENDFESLKDMFNEIKLLSMNEDPDYKDQNRMLKKISSLQRNIHAFEMVVEKK